jgi:membrane protease YdiL (CAAX protease family)
MKRMLKKLSEYRRAVVTGLLVFGSIAFLGLFKESDAVNPTFQFIIVSIVFFLLVPMAYTRWILDEPFSTLGFRRGKSIRGVVAGTVCVSAGLLASYCLLHFTPFASQYSLPYIVRSDFLWFMAYELVIVAGMAFLYEVFFRGFIQLSWFKDQPIVGIAVSSIMFWGLYALSGGVVWQQAPFLLFAPLAGVVAAISGSIWYSWMASWMFLFLADVLFLMIR